MAHTINDYLELITSQYQNSPKYKKWVERLLTPYIDTQKLASTLYTYFDIDKAVGKQLDMLGEVIGVKRLLPFQPEGSGTGTPNPIFNKSAFTVVGNPTITDDGIASGFTSTGRDYVYCTFPESNIPKESISIKSSLTHMRKSSNSSFIWCWNLNYALEITAGGNVQLKYPTGTEQAPVGRAFTVLSGLKVGDVVDTTTTVTPTKLSIIINGQLFEKEDTVLFSYFKKLANRQIRIGMPNVFTDKWYSICPIDLKSFSITVDGKEVFSGSQLNPLLDDENYRFLLKAQILRNVWNGTNQHIYEIWNELHSDIAIAIKDNQDMTVTALFIGDLNKLQQEMIKYGMIVPKAQGVKMFYAFSLPPLFSYDQDTEYFKGYDEGNWAENII